MEALKSKPYFEEVSQDWDSMGNSFFGDRPRDTIYKDIKVTNGMHIADIGSGAGYLLEPLIDEAVHLYAFDQSPNMLQVIKTKFGDKVNAIESTSENLDCPTGHMDIVMANMYLHHVERPKQAITEMVRILKPGGTLIFTDLDRHDYDFLITEQHDRWKGFERSDIEQWMSIAGLQKVLINCVGATCCADSGCSDTKAEIGIFIAKGIK